jgi:Ecdysteroid kinase-like family
VVVDPLPVAGVTIPSELAQVDASWLSAALSIKYPGTEVTGLTVGRVINGTATKLRLLFEYNEAGNQHGLPSTMWLKAGFEEHSAQQAKLYMGETNFYAYLADDLDIGCPRSYFAHIEPERGRSAILLEDLQARNVRFTDARKPLTPKEASRVISLLARLHARYWNLKGVRQYSWLKPGGALLDSGVIDSFFSSPVWEKAMSLPRSEFVTGRLRDIDAMRSAMLGLLERDKDRAHCLLHGDSHIGNLTFDLNGKPAYVDWQTVMLGHWAHDVANFIPLALSVTDRRHCEQDLIRQYLHELTALGIDSPDFSEAWDEYRAHVLYTFNFVLCPRELQPEEICYPSAERACSAITDLGSLDACLARVH